jgi:hypothetical protein
METRAEKDNVRTLRLGGHRQPTRGHWFWLKGNGEE